MKPQNKKILIATRNPGKFAEIKSFIFDLPIEVVSLTDLGIQDEVEENGKNYKQNSQKKAIFYAKVSNLPTIADDGGIEISALAGEPGIKSKRWVGSDSTDQKIIEHMLKISAKLPDNNRKAYFRTVISFALPNGKVWSAAGQVEGEISKKPYLKPLKGYPYRSFFYLPPIKKYYHEDELTEDEQRMYNHRYKAIAKLKPIISRVILNSVQDLKMEK